jgi:diaminohydroxyphosphoribosylaminopyrimidine deaminase / 5-amino-6-(5-phosphoribosylamino)uracil reductase
MTALMTGNGYPSPADRRWLRHAVALSRQATPGPRFRVGAVLVDAEGNLLGEGFTGQLDPADHAEEVALANVSPEDPRLAGATVYSSLEPCGQRASRAVNCAELIIRLGVRRVAFAMREPALLAAGKGAALLADAGVEVVEVPELASEVRAVNSHLLG